MTLQQRITDKLSALRACMAQEGLDGLVITDHTDQFYILGFHFSAGEAVFLVYGGRLVCFARELYVHPLKEKYPFIDAVGADKGAAARAIELAGRLGLKRVGFDAGKENYMTGSLFKAAGFVEADSFISRLRKVKDEHEAALLRDSCRIACQTYLYIRPLLQTGVTEFEVAAEIEKFMRMKGASSTSFDTIVAFGENGANPHHVTSRRALKENDAVLMDFGCVYEGYCSDITRSWWHGSEEPEEYTKIWNLVDKARRTGIAAQAPGVAAQKVDAAARAVITDAGYGAYFTHRLGHGVGLEIHEEPCNDQTTRAVLKKGNVVTVEPGIYLPGKFGVRLEDTTLITETGAEILTKE